MKRPRIITDMTGDEPVVYINFEVTLEESQTLERGLRRLLDPGLAGARAAALWGLIAAFTMANPRVEEM